MGREADMDHLGRGYRRPARAGAGGRRAVRSARRLVLAVQAAAVGRVPGHPRDEARAALRQHDDGAGDGAAEPRPVRGGRRAALDLAPARDGAAPAVQRVRGAAHAPGAGVGRAAQVGSRAEAPHGPRRELLADGEVRQQLVAGRRGGGDRGRPGRDRQVPDEDAAVPEDPVPAEDPRRLRRRSGLLAARVPRVRPRLGGARGRGDGRRAAAQRRRERVPHPGAPDQPDGSRRLVRPVVRGVVRAGRRRLRPAAVRALAPLQRGPLRAHGRGGAGDAAPRAPDHPRPARDRAAHALRADHRARRHRQLRAARGLQRADAGAAGDGAAAAGARGAAAGGDRARADVARGCGWARRS